MQGFQGSCERDYHRQKYAQVAEQQPLKGMEQSVNDDFLDKIDLIRISHDFYLQTMFWLHVSIADTYHSDNSYILIII